MKCCLCEKIQYVGKSEYSSNLRINTYRNDVWRTDGPTLNNWTKIGVSFAFGVPLIKPFFLKKKNSLSFHSVWTEYYRFSKFCQVLDIYLWMWKWSFSTLFIDCVYSNISGMKIRNVIVCKTWGIFWFVYVFQFILLIWI